MPKIIKGGVVVDDNWQVIRDLEQPLPEGPVIVPVDMWQQNRDSLLARGDVAVWLGSEQSPKCIADDLQHLVLIALDFPKFADGRAFSYARELREQHQYRGEIRAIGDFMRDQLFYMHRCGFDSFALGNTDIEQALASLKDFSESYQVGQDQPLPLFRRR